MAVLDDCYYCYFFYNGNADYNMTSECTPGQYISAYLFDMRASNLTIPEGYTFEGWYTTETFEEGTKVTGDYYPTQDTNFYAKVVPPATFASKMTAINNEIRTMTNTTAPLGLDAMKDHLADANEEISEQDALVEQLISAMRGKSVPGGGSGNAVETCTVTFELPDAIIIRALAYTEYVDGNSNIKLIEQAGGEYSTSFVLENVVCGTMIAVYHSLTYPGVTVSNNVEVMRNHASNGWFKVLATNGAEATIKIYDDM